MKKSYKDITVTLLGGDDRMRIAANLLTEQGFKVIDKPDGLCDTATNYLILPLPMTADGVHLNCRGDSKPRLADLAEKISARTKVLAGCVSERSADIFEQHGLCWQDYYTDEALLCRNAYLTAEATLQLVMQNTHSTVKGAGVLVIGSGRCGKAAARLFKRVGARVTLTSRKFKDKLKALAIGAKPAQTANLEALVPRFDVIINTVAHPLLTERVLQGIAKDSLVVELASSAAGVDMAAAEKLGTNLIYAPGLPGKHLPQSAAEAICGTLIKIITEESL